jgi:hypothetical protein
MLCPANQQLRPQAPINQGTTNDDAARAPAPGSMQACPLKIAELHLQRVPGSRAQVVAYRALWRRLLSPAEPTPQAQDTANSAAKEMVKKREAPVGKTEASNDFEVACAESKEQGNDNSCIGEKQADSNRDLR